MAGTIRAKNYIHIYLYLWGISKKQQWSYIQTIYKKLNIDISELLIFYLVEICMYLQKTVNWSKFVDPNITENSGKSGICSYMIKKKNNLKD